MLEWLQGLGGPQFATALLWTLTTLILLVVVLVVVRLIRSMTFGTFVAGGRNRKTRLAVMDATAVDSHRRLVLIRRDDTEHLLLIGGPTDVVVERDIKLSQPRRPALTGHPGPETLPHPKPRLTDAPAPGPRQPEPGPRQPEPAPARPPTPVQVPPRPAAPPPAAPAARRQSAPQAVRSPEQVKPPPPARPAADAVLPPPPPHRPPPAVPPPAPPPHSSNGTESSAMAHAAAPPVARTSSTSLDETLLRELEVTFDSDPSPNPTRMAKKLPELTLDEEMTKLLGELSSHKRS